MSSYESLLGELFRKEGTLIDYYQNEFIVKWRGFVYRQLGVSSAVKNRSRIVG